MQHDLYPYLILTGVKVTLVRRLDMCSRLERLPEGCQFNFMDIRFKIMTRTVDSELLITNTILNDKSKKT